MNLGLNMKVTELFFDREAVIREVEAIERKALSKAGAFVRTRARSSIRRRKKSSQPGQPPSAHGSDPVATPKNIVFAYEPALHSVVIGPVKINHSGDSNFSNSSPVPQTLEFGGTVAVKQMLSAGQWVPVGGRRPRPGQQTRVANVTYQPRAFMGPAFQAELPNFPQLFSNR